MASNSQPSGPPPLHQIVATDASTGERGSHLQSASSMSDLHNAESGSDTTGGHGQSITLVVKTDSDDEHVQPGNPPLLLTSAADAHMARIPGEAFTDFSTTLAMNQQAGGMALAAPGVSSSAGTAYYSPHAMGMGSNAQAALVLAPSVLVSPHTDSDATPGSKRQVRLIKNREAAKECRRKKKEYVRCLENRVAVLEAQNTKLMEELKTLKDMYCNKVDETGPQGAHPSMPPNAVPDGVSVTVQPVPPGMSVQMLNAMQQQQPPMQQ